MSYGPEVGLRLVLLCACVLRTTAYFKIFDANKASSDTDEMSLTGNYWASLTQDGFEGGDRLYLSSSSRSGHGFYVRPNMDLGGPVDVFCKQNVYSTYGPMTYQIDHTGGTTYVEIDLSEARYTAMWVFLGRFVFAASPNDNRVLLDASIVPTSQTVPLDAFKVQSSELAMYHSDTATQSSGGTVTANPGAIDVTQPTLFRFSQLNVPNGGNGATVSFSNVHLSLPCASQSTQPASKLKVSFVDTSYPSDVASLASQANSISSLSLVGEVEWDMTGTCNPTINLDPIILIPVLSSPGVVMDVNTGKVSGAVFGGWSVTTGFHYCGTYSCPSGYSSTGRRLYTSSKTTACVVSYEPNITVSGWYSITAYFYRGSDRSTNVVYYVYHNNQVEQVSVSHKGGWGYTSTTLNNNGFYFSKDAPGQKVVISTSDSGDSNQKQADALIFQLTSYETGDLRAESPDLSSALHSVVSRTDWQRFNDIGIVVQRHPSDTSSNSWTTYDLSQSVVKLFFNYTTTAQLRTLTPSHTAIQTLNNGDVTVDPSTLKISSNYRTLLFFDQFPFAHNRLGANAALHAMLMLTTSSSHSSGSAIVVAAEYSAYAMPPVDVVSTVSSRNLTSTVASWSPGALATSTRYNTTTPTELGESILQVMTLATWVYNDPIVLILDSTDSTDYSIDASSVSLVVEAASGYCDAQGASSTYTCKEGRFIKYGYNCTIVCGDLVAATTAIFCDPQTGAFATSLTCTSDNAQITSASFSLTDSGTALQLSPSWSSSTYSSFSTSVPYDTSSVSIELTRSIQGDPQDLEIVTDNAGSDITLNAFDCTWCSGSCNFECPSFEACTCITEQGTVSLYGSFTRTSSSIYARNARGFALARFTPSLKYTTYISLSMLTFDTTTVTIDIQVRHANGETWLTQTTGSYQVASLGSFAFEPGSSVVLKMPDNDKTYFTYLTFGFTQYVAVGRSQSQHAIVPIDYVGSNTVNLYVSRTYRFAYYFVTVTQTSPATDTSLQSLQLTNNAGETQNFAVLSSNAFVWASISYDATTLSFNIALTDSNAVAVVLWSATPTTQNSYGPTSTLVGNINFDDSLVADTNGTFAVKSPQSFTIVTGQVGAAVDFGSKSQKFSTTWTSQSFSVSVWVNYQGPSSRITIFSTTSTSLVMTTLNQIEFEDGVSSSALTSSATITQGSWTHITVVRDQATFVSTIYIDGIASGTVLTPHLSDEAMPVWPDSDLTLGVWGGYLDEFRVYGSALVELDVFQLYHTGTILYSGVSYGPVSVSAGTSRTEQTTIVAQDGVTTRTILFSLTTLEQPQSPKILTMNLATSNPLNSTVLGQDQTLTIDITFDMAAVDVVIYNFTTGAPFIGQSITSTFTSTSKNGYGWSAPDAVITNDQITSTSRVSGVSVARHSIQDDSGENLDLCLGLTTVTTSATHHDFMACYNAVAEELTAYYQGTQQQSGLSCTENKIQVVIYDGAVRVLCGLMQVYAYSQSFTYPMYAAEITPLGASTAPTMTWTGSARVLVSSHASGYPANTAVSFCSTPSMATNSFIVVPQNETDFIFSGVEVVVEDTANTQLLPASCVVEEFACEGAVENSTLVYSAFTINCTVSAQFADKLLFVSENTTELTTFSASGSTTSYSATYTSSSSDLEGKVHFYVQATNADDVRFTTYGLPETSGGASTIYTDVTRPYAVAVNVSSTNAYSSAGAIPGQNVTIAVTLSEPCYLTVTSATVGGTSVLTSVKTGSQPASQITVTLVTPSSVNGLFAYTFQIQDIASNLGTAISDAVADQSVVVDSVSPTITIAVQVVVSTTRDVVNPSYAITGDVLNITATFSESVRTASITALSIGGVSVLSRVAQPSTFPSTAVAVLVTVQSGDTGVVVVTFSAQDALGNTQTAALTTSVLADTTAPSFSSGEVTSSNENMPTGPTAREGDDLVVSILASESLATFSFQSFKVGTNDRVPSVTCSNSGTVSCFATYTVTSADSGALTFTLASITDLAGNVRTVATTSAGFTNSITQIDNVVPTLVINAFSNNTNPDYAHPETYAKAGQLITVTATPSEPLSYLTLDSIRIGTVDYTSAYSESQNKSDGLFTYAQYTIVAKAGATGPITFSLSFRDAVGWTSSATHSSAVGSVTADSTAPTLTSVVLSSTNALSTKYISTGNTMFIKVVASENLSKLTASSFDVGDVSRLASVIQPNSASFPTTNNITVSYVVISGDDGLVTFELSYKDVAGNDGAVVNFFFASNQLIADTSVPVISSIGVYTTNKNSTLATTGEAIRLVVTTTKLLSRMNVTLAIGGVDRTGFVSVTSLSLDPPKYQAAYTVRSGDTGALSFSVAIVDEIGNSGAAVNSTSSIVNATVLVDTTKPVLAFVLVDTGNPASTTAIRPGDTLTIVVNSTEPLVQVQYEFFLDGVRQTVEFSGDLPGQNFTFAVRTSTTDATGSFTFTIGGQDATGNLATSLTEQNTEPLSIVGQAVEVVSVLASTNNPFDSSIARDGWNDTATFLITLSQEVSTFTVLSFAIGGVSRAPRITAVNGTFVFSVEYTTQGMLPTTTVDAGTISFGLFVKSTDGIDSTISSTKLQAASNTNLYVGSSDATLSKLRVSALETWSGFSQLVFVYNHTVNDYRTFTWLYATLNYTTSNSRVLLTGDAYSSGEEIGTLPLQFGDNELTLTTIADDQSTSLNYTLTITRRTSADASLRSLFATLSDGSETLSPELTYGLTEYSSFVPQSVSSLNITTITRNQFANVTVTANGQQLGSQMVGGSATEVPLTYGVNLVSILVSATDGVHTTTYTIECTRQGLWAAVFAGQYATFAGGAWGRYFAKSGFTVEAWAMVTSADGGVVGPCDETSASSWCLGVSGGMWYASFASATATATGLAIDDTMWYHVAMTYDKSTLTVFVNGEARATASGASLAIDTSLAVLLMGRITASGTQATLGRLQDFAVFRGVVSTALLASHAHHSPRVSLLDSNLLGLYSFQNTAETNTVSDETVADWTHSHFTASVVGTAVSYSSGVIGCAVATNITFVDSSDDPDVLEGTLSFTRAANETATDGYALFLATGTSAQQRFVQAANVTLSALDSSSTGSFVVNLDLQEVQRNSATVLTHFQVVSFGSFGLCDFGSVLLMSDTTNQVEVFMFGSSMDFAGIASVSLGKIP